MNELIKADAISGKIYLIRGMQVMLDRDLAELYETETRTLKQAVKRNSDKFPEDFMFELGDMEVDQLVSQSVIPSKQHLGGAFPYAFVSKLVRKAKTSIELIDNYVDDSVLTLLSKRKKNVSARIYTKGVSKQLQLDLEKHNAQYPPVEIVSFGDAHDRFLILDEKEVYHLGASLKDLGKKWFAFSKIEKDALTVVGKLEKKRGKN